jgi:hypothetical protein
MNLKISNVMVNARNDMTDGAFQQAGCALSAAKQIVREEAQKKTSSQMKAIIDKLRTSDPISDQEASLIKTWIVGDAEGYLEMENDFPSWLSEYDRLVQSLADYEKKDCSSEELLMLRGILDDATRISYDIANYLENQGRVRKLESALADGLDERERDVLVETLFHKLNSQDY